MLNINKHGIRKIKRNMLNMIYNILKNLNIKNLIERMYTNTIGQKKMRIFHQIHLQQIYVSKLCLIFVLILLQRYLKSGCAVCGKLTPICEMEELSEIENVSLLKFDGVTRKSQMQKH